MGRKFVDGITVAFGLVKAILGDFVRDDDLSVNDNTTNDVSGGAHGFCPKLPNDPDQFFNGVGGYTNPIGVLTTLGDTLYFDGGLRRLPGNADVTRRFLRQNGTGAVSSPPVWDRPQDQDLVLSDTTINNVTTLNHGFCPKLPNDATKFFNGIGGYTVPAVGVGVPQVQTVTVSYLDLVGIGAGLTSISDYHLGIDVANKTLLFAWVSHRVAFDGGGCSSALAQLHINTPGTILNPGAGGIPSAVRNVGPAASWPAIDDQPAVTTVTSSVAGVGDVTLYDNGCYSAAAFEIAGTTFDLLTQGEVTFHLLLV